jgi:hypothetical protein
VLGAAGRHIPEKDFNINISKITPQRNIRSC